MHGARARAGSAWAGGGGAGAARAECSKAPRNAASARTRGGGRGEGIKGAGFPLPDPPFLPGTPTRLKGWTVVPPLWPGLFVRQSGNTLHTPPSTLPLLSAFGARGPSARACQGPRARARPRLPEHPRAPARPRSPRPPRAPPARALPWSCAICAATCSRARRRCRPAVPSRHLPGPWTCWWPTDPWIAAAHATGASSAEYGHSSSGRASRHFQVF